MKAWYEMFKPRASKRVQLMLAGALWSCVGAGLLMAGVSWIIAGSLNPADLVMILAGLLLGGAKARFILDRTALKIADRIGARGEGRCVGGFLSLRSWFLVLMMIALGRLLRSFLPSPLAGILYTTIGSGLLFSSRLAWQQWYTSREN